MAEYLKKFPNFKKEIMNWFTRGVNIKLKTFKAYPSRWNKLAKDNSIEFYIMEDTNNLEITTIYPDKKPYNNFF
jgi:hypothetical protein